MHAFTFCLCHATCGLALFLFFLHRIQTFNYCDTTPWHPCRPGMVLIDEYTMFYVVAGDWAVTLLGFLGIVIATGVLFVTMDGLWEAMAPAGLGSALFALARGLWLLGFNATMILSLPFCPKELGCAAPYDGVSPLTFFYGMVGWTVCMAGGNYVIWDMGSRAQEEEEDASQELI